nr:hypothetical protein [Siccirubricoccus sp. G192]
MPAHQPNQDHQVAVDPIIGFRQVKIGRIGEAMGTDSGEIGLLVVDLSSAVNINELFINNMRHGFGIIAADGCDAGLLQPSHGLKRGLV